MKGGADSVKDFEESLGDEIWEKWKFSFKKNSPLGALCAPQFREEVKMWVNSSSGHNPQLLLASDATPAGYSKQRPEGLRPVQQTNTLVRSDDETLQIWKRTHKQKEGLLEKTWSFIV